MKRDLKPSLFKKILLYFLITVFVPTVSISSVYLHTYSNELKDKFEATEETDVANLSSQIHTVTNQIDNLSLQLTFLTGLNSILSRPNSASMYDYILLQDQLKDQISVSNMIQSAYIYFKLNDKVLTTNEGLYDRKQFFDRDYIDGLLGSEHVGHEYQVRQVQPPLASSRTETVTIARELPLVGNDSLGYLIVNVDKEALFKTFRNLIRSDSQNIFIADLNRNLVFFGDRDNSLAAPIAELLTEKRITDNRNTDVVSLGGDKYFLSYNKIESTSWLLAKAVPYRQYETAMIAKVVSTAKIALSILLLGIVLSYLFALAVYSPWRKMIANYSAILYNGIPLHKMDEVALIRSGIDQLLLENNQIKSNIEQMKPMTRHKLIFDILNNHITDIKLAEHLLQQNGFCFSFPHFLVCIANCHLKAYERTDEYSQMKLVMFGLIENAFSQKFPCAGTLLDEGRFAFIINLDLNEQHREWKREFEEIYRNVSESVQTELHVPLQYSVSDLCSSIRELPEACAQAKRGLKYNALINETDIVFMTESQEEKGIPYPASLQKMLVSSMKSADRKAMNDAVTSLFQQYIYNNKFPPDKTQELITILIGSIVGDLLQEGYDPEELNTSDLLKINDCGNNQELESMIRCSLENVIDKLEPKDKKIDNIYVQKAIQYMEENYQNSISISDIADYVGLSPNYLSRIFKLETGSPPLDYLTKYRICRGKELLLNSKRYSLQEIGGMIGYPDVQSFIRFFKKYEAMTPHVYRKLLTEKK